MRSRVLLSAATIALAAFASGVAAQYPEKPVRIIVPFSPGGGSDLTSRVLSQRLTEAFGRQVVVENRPGGAGNIGTEMVARAPANGHTLLLATISTAVNVSLFPKSGIDPVADFEPVSLVVTVPLIFAVRNSLPAQNVQDVIRMAKAKPDGLNYASGGSGTANHIGGELFKVMADVRIAHVPYKGGGPALGDLAGGHVDMFFGTMTSTKDLAKSGRIRGIAVTTAARSASWPELPTVAEQGVPGFDVATWFGMMAPAGTPRPIVDRLSTEIAKLLKIPEVRESLLAQGNDPVGSTPEAFGRHLRDEIAKWAKVVRASGMHAD